MLLYLDRQSARERGLFSRGMFKQDGEGAIQLPLLGADNMQVLDFVRRPAAAREGLA